jgi:anti-sigma B factor antagonist
MLKTPQQDGWQPFRCDVEADRGMVRVVPHGELDVATAPEVDRHLRELAESGFDNVVLDLRALEFMDSTGLRLIMRADAVARADGATFTLIPGPPGVMRVFEVSGVWELLTFSPPARPA